jgi:hypothetical protein
MEMPQSVAPATVWNPVIPGVTVNNLAGNFVRSATTGKALPASEEEIAYAPVTQLSSWIETKAITSERLTEIYLARLERFNPKLRCVITLTRDHALEQARQADKEMAAGKHRGPLHGIPWGAKDLLDTAGIPTTYGAEPYRDRVPKEDAAVTARLNAAGAVLVAKLSLGALALNDIWFGGQTMNPWIPDAEGASAGSRYRRGAGGICDRQRNRRQHRLALDALRRHRSQAHLWTRSPDWSNDALLVARQAGPDGAQRRRHDAGVAGDLRGRLGRCGLRAQHA